MSEQADLVIIGGGASGQAAAIAAAHGGYRGRILILEKEKKFGRKILASGNGRCNLSHRPVGSEDYRSHEPEELRRIFRALTDDPDMKLFALCDIPVKRDEEGRYYPLSEEAWSVQTLLEDCLARLGVDTRAETEVVAIGAGSEFIRLDIEEGDQIFCRELIIAGGGSAAPHLGGSDRAVRLSESLGLQTYAESPTLSAWILDEKALCQSASGARFKGSARWGNHCVSGEFLFAKDGISGIAAMEMGLEFARREGYWTGKEQKQVYRFRNTVNIEVDLLASRDEEELTRFFKRAERSSGSDWRRWLRGCVHSRIIRGLSKARARTLDRLAGDSHRELASYLKRFPLEVNGLRGFHGAQSTYGGVALSEIDDQFRLKRDPRVSLCGEVLDVAGNTGGYNLFFAFASGMMAGLGRI